MFGYLFQPYPQPFSYEEKGAQEKKIMNFSTFYSTLFNIGYFPKAPGTAGTFVAALVYFLLPESMFISAACWIFFLLIVLILSIISVHFISKAEKVLGHDNGKIIIDEFFGYFFSVLFLPKTILIIIGSFLLFRFFDILKPEPVNILQKLPEGWGVMADDVMAGIYANLILQVLVRIF